MTETPISIEVAQKSVPPVGQPREPAFTPMTVEEKSLHTNRLQGEGRWPEFNARREEIRLELKEKGGGSARARENSWRQALEEYPPLSEKEKPKEPEEPALTDEQIVRLEEASSEVDIKADILFAYKKRWLDNLTIMSFEERPNAYQFWKLGKAKNEKFVELALRYLRQDDETDPGTPDERDVELGDLMTAMEKEFPVEGATEACPACNVVLQLPNSLRTGDAADAPEFHLRRAG